MSNVETRNGNFTRQIDMLKLELAFFNELERDNCEWGGIGLDPKRPFGNSYMPGDVLEILGVEPDEDGIFHSDEHEAYAISLYEDLVKWLKDRHIRQIQGLLQILDPLNE